MPRSSSDGGFSYTPAAGFRGVDAFGYQADDGNGILGDGRATLLVSCPVLGVTPTTLIDAVTGLPYAPVAFAAANAEGSVAWTQTGALPSGMNLSAAGVLDGTPTQSGGFPITVTATDAGGCRGKLGRDLDRRLRGNRRDKPGQRDGSSRRALQRDLHRNRGRGQRHLHAG